MTTNTTTVSHALRFKRLVILSPLFVIFSIAGELCAQFGDLMITPPRVVFEERKRFQELAIVNVGEDTSTYALSWKQYRMTDDGKFEEIFEPDSGQYFADEFIRFFPRRVTLAPQESQIIRMQLRLPANLPDGEYRSHLYFRALQETAPLGEIESQDNSSINIRLTPIYGWAIPVIVRKGTLDAQTTLSDFSWSEMDKPDPRPVLTFTINREGAASIFGDFTVRYRPDNGDESIVGILNGVAVYTPNLKRRVAIPLELPETGSFDRGDLFVRFSSRSDLREEVIAEKELLIQ
jgi:hypothetical protein